MAGIATAIAAALLVASCGQSGTGSGQPGSDGGRQDATVTCGTSGEPCCNAASCKDAAFGPETGDVTGTDATLDSAGDVAIADVGGDTPYGSEAGEASASDASADSEGDVVVADAGLDAAIGPEAGDASATIASCQAGGAGLTNCGAVSERCCTSLEVPGGTYYRTYTSDADGGPVGEADPASVSGLRLDKYLVTVGRFRQFVNAVLPPDGGAGWLPTANSGKHTHLNQGLGLVNVGDDGGVAYETGWVASDDSNVAPTNTNLTTGSRCYPYATWTASAGNNENLPINCVNWWESYAFCIWDGGFLPSEAEWEYVAAGGDQQREYPWGSTAPGTGNQYAIYGCYYPSGGGPGSCSVGVSNITPVGTATLGAGLWGQLDMAGTVFEWNLDWYAAYVNPCTDCAYLTAASNRVSRGDGFGGTPPFLLSSTRNSFPPSDRNGGLGLRCARPP
jgi:formylglycine-generating enzyme